MLKTLGETISLIETGCLLHISASVPLLKKLPKGNWIGGSTEFFLTPEGGLNSDDVLEVYVLPFNEYKICTYDAKNIPELIGDAYEHGFSLIIIPARSDISLAYSKYSFNNKQLARKNIAGWASGAASIHSNSRTLPITADGVNPDGFYTDKAVALHVSLPLQKTVNIGIINIFSPKKESPVITFKNEGMSAKNCLIDGEEYNLAEYLSENKINIRLPLIADCTEDGINVSIDKVKDGMVYFGAPVYEGVNYRLSDEVGDYTQAFRRRIEKFKGRNFVFSCNCVLNYVFGELDGKDLGGFYGPVCYGEIAGSFFTQTLVYLEVI